MAFYNEYDLQAYVNSIHAKLASIDALKELKVHPPFHDERNRQIFKKKLALYQKVWLKLNSIDKDDAETRDKLETLRSHLEQAVAQEQGLRR